MVVTLVIASNLGPILREEVAIGSARVSLRVRYMARRAWKKIVGAF